MTDIRPIREPEAETFLTLLCDVFGLDFNRAHDVFFSEPLFDLERKWALFEGPEMISILTTTPLEFGWGKAYGIAGVATRKSRQNEGHASKLLERVHRESKRRGEGAALLFARDLKLYERCGFAALDRVIRVPLRVENRPLDDLADPMPQELVQALYNAWAEGHPDRLRRDVRRWNYWKWHFRMCEEFQDGYVCYEPGTLREAICSEPVSAIALPAPSDWYGTAFMTDQLEIPIGEPITVELYLMGRDVPGIPQMFMTDQF